MVRIRPIPLEITVGGLYRSWRNVRLLYRDIGGDVWFLSLLEGTTELVVCCKVA